MNKLVFLILTLISSLSFAQNWQPIAENQHYQVSLKVDHLKAVQREGQALLQAWTNWQVYTEQGPDDELQGDFSMVLYYINCHSHSIAEASRTRYFANGTERNSKATTWHELSQMPTESMGARIIHAACQKQPQG